MIETQTHDILFLFESFEHENTDKYEYISVSDR